MKISLNKRLILLPDTDSCHSFLIPSKLSLLARLMKFQWKVRHESVAVAVICEVTGNYCRQDPNLSGNPYENEKGRKTRSEGSCLL